MKTITNARQELTKLINSYATSTNLTVREVKQQLLPIYNSYKVLAPTQPELYYILQLVEVMKSLGGESTTAPTPTLTTHINSYTTTLTNNDITHNKEDVTKAINHFYNLHGTNKTIASINFYITQLNNLHLTFEPFSNKNVEICVAD